LSPEDFKFLLPFLLPSLKLSDGTVSDHHRPDHGKRGGGTVLRDDLLTRLAGSDRLSFGHEVTIIIDIFFFQSHHLAEVS
jgi:hypothetical protein